MFETDIGEDREHSGSFCYVSVPLYAGRELWLSLRSRTWVPVECTIQSCYRTLGGYKETIRVDVWYGYEIGGNHYAGRMIRDRVLGGVQKVVDDYAQGKNAIARVNPDTPSQSYLPSGIGYLEPLFVGIVSLGTIAILSFILVSLILVGFGH